MGADIVVVPTARFDGVGAKRDTTLASYETVL